MMSNSVSESRRALSGSATRAVVWRGLLSVLLGLTFVQEVSGQSFTIQGSVRTSRGPVRFASITFIDQSDPTRTFDALTDGAGTYHVNVVTSAPSGSTALPQDTRLDQNFPNPFSASTAISYKLQRGAEVKLAIFDILGREVKALDATFQDAGVHAVHWDGRNVQGAKVAAGVYFCYLRVGRETHVKKMLVTGSDGVVGNVARATTSLWVDESVPQIARANSMGRYTVHVTNTDSTEPRISVTQFFALAVNRDTTLDFRVKDAPHNNMNLYVGNWGYDEVFVIDTDKEHVVDTLKGFFSAGNLTVTKSGARLYVTTIAQFLPYPNNDSLVPAVLFSVDPRSKSKQVIFAGESDVVLTPNGVPLIIAKGRIGTIDTLSGALSFFDSLDISPPLLCDPHRPILYGTTHEYRLLAYNYQDRKVVRQYASTGSFLHMAVSVDGKYIYCAGGPVLDLEADSLVGWVGSGCGQTAHGSLALTADGSYLYITDPANWMIPEPVPSGQIAVLQTSDMSSVGCIDVNIVSGQAYTPTDDIVIARDGEKAYVTDYWGGIFVVDLGTNSITNYIVISRRNINTRSIALGVR